MQIPAKKLLRLLQTDQPLEVRCAAALVLGELGARDTEIAKALCEQLADGEAALRLQVVKAVGKLRVDAALSRLLEVTPAAPPLGERVLSLRLDPVCSMVINPGRARATLTRRLNSPR